MQKDLKFHHTFLFSQNSIGILKEEENRIEFKKFNVPNENFAQTVIHSLVNEGQLNLDTCMKRIIEHSDLNNVTTLQHKILYLTMHFFTSFQASNQNRKLWLIQWLSNAAKLFQKQEQQVPVILEMLYNGELQNFLTELKIIQLKQKKNLRKSEGKKPSLCDRIQFLMEIGYKKLLLTNSKIDKSVDKKSYQMQTKLNLREKNKEFLKNINQEGNKQLSKTLTECLSILLGDEEFIRKKTKSCFYTFAKLYLLYVGQAQIQELETKFYEGNKIKIEPQSVEDYFIRLLKNQNYHKVFQISLTYLEPYFAYLLASLTFYLNPKSKEVLRNDSEYRYRVMINMLDESSKICYKVFLSTAKLYQELENHRKEQFEEIANLYYRYFTYDIVTSYHQVHEIRQIFEYMREINMNESYFRDYISNLLSLHLKDPITKYTLQVIMIDLLLYYPEQLDYFVFTYFRDGYLLDSNLQIPFDYDILNRLKQLTGQKTEIENERVCRDFINHFQDFFQMQKLEYQSSNSKKGKMLMELMKRKKFQAKGEILRVGKKILQDYHTCNLQQKQNKKEQIIELRDCLKLYIEDMEYKQQYCSDLTKLKNILY